MYIKFVIIASNYFENLLSIFFKKMQSNLDRLFHNIKKEGPLLKDDDPNAILEFQEEWQRRELFVKKYSWAVPSKEVINKIVEFIDNDKCLETGSGAGLWAYLLQQYNVDIIATDKKTTVYNYYYTDVETLSDKDAMEKYNGKNTLLVCWSVTNPTTSFKGNKIVYIGDRRKEYGCTDGEPDENEWELVEKVQLSNWIYIRDFLAFYRRKSNKAVILISICAIIIFSQIILY